MRWFHQSYRVVETTGCWIWTGNVHKGKARISVGNRGISARRASYAIAFGEEPSDDVKITLSCDERLCVNPEHFILTRKSLLVGEGQKYCSRCKEIKPLSAFSPCKTGAGGVFNYCRPCSTLHQRNLVERKPELVERSRLRNYGLTPEQYVGMLEAQGGVCAICGGLNGERPLAIDHDHGSGRVRSLLCNHCNSGLAHFRHDLDLVRAALAYLEDWSSKGAVSPPNLSRALAVLGPERLEEIRQRIAKGEPAYRLAKEYGVTKKAISDVRTEMFHRQKVSQCDARKSISADPDALASSSASLESESSQNQSGALESAGTVAAAKPLPLPA